MEQFPIEYDTQNEQFCVIDTRLPTLTTDSPDSLTT